MHFTLPLGAPHIPYLDLDRFIGQRSSTFHFHLVDGATGQRLTELTPTKDTIPTLSHDTGQTIKRRVDIDLGIGDTLLIDPINNRIEISMEVDGAGVFPLGQYLFIDATMQVTSAGHLSSGSIIDEMFILDQPRQVGFGSDATPLPVQVMLQKLMDQFPQITFSAEASSYQSLQSWPASTSSAKILDDLALAGDWLSPWFDHTGTMRLVRAFDPADRPVDIDLDEHQRVYADSIAHSNDLLTAPNQIIVISNAPLDSDVAVVGSYDVPDSAPHSALNRGFVVAESYDLQVTSTGQANAVAALIGRRRNIFERVTLSTPPDPRHDSYNVIRWAGQNWLELSWSMQLVEGGAMQHTMRRIFI